jgi:hypothetical protein
MRNSQKLSFPWQGSCLHQSSLLMSWGFYPSTNKTEGKVVYALFWQSIVMINRGVLCKSLMGHWGWGSTGKNLFLAMFSVSVVWKNSGGFQTGNVRSRGSSSLAICVSLCK